MILSIIMLDLVVTRETSLSVIIVMMTCLLLVYFAISGTVNGNQFQIAAFFILYALLVVRVLMAYLTANELETFGAKRYIYLGGLISAVAFGIVYALLAFYIGGGIWTEMSSVLVRAGVGQHSDRVVITHWQNFHSTLLLDVYLNLTWVVLCLIPSNDRDWWLNFCILIFTVAWAAIGYSAVYKQHHNALWLFLGLAIALPVVLGIQIFDIYSNNRIKAIGHKGNLIAAGVLAVINHIVLVYTALRMRRFFSPGRSIGEIRKCNCVYSCYSCYSLFVCICMSI
jgi:hypothetical protein